MKKIIALLLSLVIVVSSMGLSASAASSAPNSALDDLLGSVDFEDALKNFNADGMIVPDEFLTDGQYDIESLLQSGLLNNVNFLGLTVDFLYNSTDELIWPTLSVSKSDIALVAGNINTYLLRLLNDLIGGKKLYTSENATAITNFIGNLIDPDFTDVKIDFGREIEEVDIFYETIAEKSTLTDVIQHNWCDQINTVNFKPLMYTLGVNFSDVMGESKFKNGKLMAELLLQSIIKKVLQVGPITYILDLVTNLAKTYNTFMFEPLRALFAGQISRGVITEDELRTLKGLFNLVSNLNDPNNADKLQFVTPPSYRFAAAKDTTEMFLYMLVYLNLVGQYNSNPYVIKNLQNNIKSSGKLNDTDKERLVAITDAVFLSNLSGLSGLLGDIFSENISGAKDNIMQKLSDFLTRILKGFISFFDRIYYSLTHFGQF